MMARKKREMRDVPQPGMSCTLVDPYANATASNYITRGQTGVCYDADSLKHKCEWDDKYPENPQRLTVIMDKCYEKGLLLRCQSLPNYLRTDLYEKILTMHSKEHYEKLKNLCQCANVATMECEASCYDSVYFNRFTFDSACRSLSSVLNLVTAVAKRDVQNGMAFVRPPGHHAMQDEYNGYCFFNNVAIAAEHCIQEGFSKRVMIVDIDVHHGQGTQQMFYERNDVLYFSIHRYEHGTFWPNLLESNFNYIGKGDGLGYNVNVPLNTTGLTDDDYLAIVFSILLPLGYEFNPDLIIVSAGYDAALGCPEGKMNVTPGFYAHLITLLSGLARGQIAVCLEGGYFLPTLSEAASLTLKALLGGPCPILDPIRAVHPTVVETICNVRRTLYKKWKCFKICEVIPPDELTGNPDEHRYKICYFGDTEKPPYPTRRCYPENSVPEHNYYARINKALRERYRGSPNLPVYYVYDDQMLLHTPQVGDVERPERPERLTTIMKLFDDFGVENRCVRTPIVRRDFSAYSPHSRNYFHTVNNTMRQTKDVYVNEYTHDAVLLAVSGLLNLIDVIMNATARAGVAIVRPPGHHAEHNTPMGFCFVNNVAVAANYLNMKYNLQRILIVDFDIHHGNGTQNVFYQSSHVMYISIHKDEDGKFFPTNSPRHYTYDGYGCGKGYNINIPFNRDKMGDTEYLAAFHNIILPAAYSYGPQIVIVSAGFDAGIHDPLGGYQVNPETFGHFIQMLKPLAEGRLILALEGGYNVTTTSYAMTICTKVLLGDPVIMPKNIYKKFSSEACRTIREVSNHFKRYYNIFTINKRLSSVPVLIKKVERFTEDTYHAELSKVLDIEKVDDNEYVEGEMRCLNASTR
jgi:histone deacetylase 6